MGWLGRNKVLLSVLGVIGALCALGALMPVRSQPKAAMAAGDACPNDDSGLKLPAGFCATVFADGIGHARHMVAASNGVLYVNTWSGRYYGNTAPHEGGFLVALEDKAGAGKADVVERFGETAQSGGHGGTGIGLYKDSIYAESNDRIVRYAMASGSLVPSGAAETIVSGMPLGGDHPMHPFIIDKNGEMYVDMGTATNASRRKTGRCIRRESLPARSGRRGAGPGALTRTRRIRHFLRRNDTRRGFAMGKGTRSTMRAGCS